MQHSQNLFNRYKAIGEKGKAQEFISYSSCLCMCLYLIFTVYINIHISSYFKTSRTKYQYTFFYILGFKYLYWRKDLRCTRLFRYYWNNSFIFLSNELTDFNKIYICINIEQIKQIMRRVQELWLGERNQMA